MTWHIHISRNSTYLNYNLLHYDVQSLSVNKISNHNQKILTKRLKNLEVFFFPVLFSPSPWNKYRTDDRKHSQNHSHCQLMVTLAIPNQQRLLPFQFTQTAAPLWRELEFLRSFLPVVEDNMTRMRSKESVTLQWILKSWLQIQVNYIKWSLECLLIKEDWLL